MKNVWLAFSLFFFFCSFTIIRSAFTAFFFDVSVVTNNNNKNNVIFMYLFNNWRRDHVASRWHLRLHYYRYECRHNKIITKTEITLCRIQQQQQHWINKKNVNHTCNFSVLIWTKMFKMQLPLWHLLFKERTNMMFLCCKLAYRIIGCIG